MHWLPERGIPALRKFCMFGGLGREAAVHAHGCLQASLRARMSTAALLWPLVGRSWASQRRGHPWAPCRALLPLLPQPCVPLNAFGAPARI